MPLEIPPWFARLPEFSRRPGHKTIIVDNQVFSYRFFGEGKPNRYRDFLFEDPRIIIQIGRQLIDELLHSVSVADDHLKRDKKNRPVLDAEGHPVRLAPAAFAPGLPSKLHRTMWEQLGHLQEREKLVLVGAFATSEQWILFGRLSKSIEDSCGVNSMGPGDSRVIADALARRIPIFTEDKRQRDAFGFALANRKAGLTKELEAVGLLDFARHELYVESEPDKA